MFADSISRSVKEMQNIALGEENMRFATQKCVHGRSSAKENEPLPGHQDGVSRSIAQNSLFSLLLKLGISNSASENKAHGMILLHTLTAHTKCLADQYQTVGK